jgi:thioredoxin-like negative regulator of GroEL
MARYFKANNYNDRWQNDDPQKAIETYNEIWKLAPNYVQSKFLAGLVYAKLTMHFNSLANKYIKEHNEKAKQEAVLKRDECFKQAIKYFNQYKMIDPIFPYTYFQLANLYAHSGHPELAEKEYLEHINYPLKLQEKPHNFYKEDWKQRRRSEYAQSCLNLGSLELALNKINDAELMFIESLKYVPNNIDGLKNLATVYMKKQDKNKYNEIVKKLKVLYPQDEYVKKLKENI